MEFREERKRTATTQDADSFVIEMLEEQHADVRLTVIEETSEATEFTLLESEALSLANELTDRRLAALVRAARKMNVQQEGDPRDVAHALVKAAEAFAGEFEP